MLDRRLAPFRWPSLAFAAYLLVQAGSAAALFVLKLGGGASGVRAFYLGAPERFTQARSLAGLLEVAVPHLAAVPLVLFAAVHVIGFARALPRRAFAALVALSFGSALAGVLSGFAVRFVSPAFAWLKVASFGALEVALVSWAALLVALFAPRSHGARAPRHAGAATPAEEAVP
ncbi:MAG TPA: hypothetical protein VIW03_18455 [Anaeromyxobacter sp.]